MLSATHQSGSILRKPPCERGEATKPGANVAADRDVSPFFRLAVRLKPTSHDGKTSSSLSHITHTSTSITIASNNQTATLGTPCSPITPIPPTATNAEVATSLDIRTIVHTCVAQSKDCLICCYGQSCSGKSYTIFGDGPTTDLGLIQHILNAFLSQPRHDTRPMTLTVVSYELYLTTVRPIASTRITRPEDVPLAIHRIATHRTVSPTALNQRSSRSHAFVEVRWSIPDELDIPDEERPNAEGKHHALVFVDLAGSERVSKSHATGRGLQEGIEINKSLSALGNLMRALDRYGRCGRCGSTTPHGCGGTTDLAPATAAIPWRASRLTQLLKSHIHTDTTVWFILCISTDPEHVHESMSTLRFGSTVLGIGLSNDRLRDLMGRPPRGKETTEATETILETTEMIGLIEMTEATTMNGTEAGDLAGPFLVYLFWTMLMVVYGGHLQWNGK